MKGLRRWRRWTFVNREGGASRLFCAGTPVDRGRHVATRCWLKIFPHGENAIFQCEK